MDLPVPLPPWLMKWAMIPTLYAEEFREAVITRQMG